MRSIIYLLLCIVALHSCHSRLTSEIQSPEKVQEVSPLSSLVGDYDNFLQYWKENTNDNRHRDTISETHEHIHIKIEAVDSVGNEANVSYYKDRNNKEYSLTEKWHFEKEQNGSWQIKREGKADITLSKSESGWSSDYFNIRGDTLLINHPSHTDKFSRDPYKLIRCRYFSGWLQFPIPDIPDSTYFQSNLRIHDQGGMVELDIPDADYTAELTQLEYGHRIKLMKLAIYDISLEEVGINSRSISYTWTSPDAKRLGINLRKVVSGWTLVE